MFGISSGVGRIALPVAATPIVGSILFHNNFKLINTLAIAIAAGMVVWGLAYLAVSRRDR